MSKRYVTLPNGKTCGLGTYTAAWKALLLLPPGRDCEGFGHFPQSAERILRTLRDGLTERINRHIPGYGKGRKWSEDCQATVWRLSRAINSRVITYEREVPPEYRTRLAHRYYKPGEI